MFCFLVGVLVPYGSSLVGFMCCCFCCLSFLLCGVFMFVHGQYCCVMFGVVMFGCCHYAYVFLQVGLVTEICELIGVVFAFILLDVDLSFQFCWRQIVLMCPIHT